MIEFRYSALDASGREASGAVEAATRHQAIAVLAQRGLYVTQMGTAEEPAATSPSLAWRWNRRLPPRVMAGLWRQLATAVDAGLPLLNALRVTCEQDYRHGRGTHPGSAFRCHGKPGWSIYADAGEHGACR